MPNHEIPDKIQISIPVSVDAAGYYDKECPNSDCLSQFKVKKEDWEALDESSTVYCPFCRHEAHPNSWWTAAQAEQAKQKALEQASYILTGHLNKVLGKMADDFNRRNQSNSFIKMTMKYHGWNLPSPVVLPLDAAEVMQSKHTCSQCGFQYGFVGTAYFCPGCGYFDAEAIFVSYLQQTRKMPELIEKMRGTLDRDAIANLSNTLIEDAITGGVTQFENIAKHLYEQATGSLPSKGKGNIFQRLSDASEEWKITTGKYFTEFLTQDELERLNIYFQRRHALGHNDGLVDDKYLKKSGDSSYKLSQRIIIKFDMVMDFTDLLERLVNGMRISL